MHAPSITDPLLAEIVRRLADVYRPEEIYLFGSTARLDAGPHSDYDLMIIVADDAPPGLRTPEPGYRAMEGLPRSGDFLVWTRHDFHRRLHLRASLPATILREGRRVYGS